MLGKVLQSTPLKVIGAALTCAHVTMWLFVSAMTVYRGVIRGELFHAPCLAPPAAASADEQGDEGLQALPLVVASPACSLPAGLQELEAKLSLSCTPSLLLQPDSQEVQYLREQLSAASALLQGLPARGLRNGSMNRGDVGVHGLQASRAGSGVLSERVMQGHMGGCVGHEDELGCHGRAFAQQQWLHGGASKGV